MEGEVIVSASREDSIFIWEAQSLTVLAHFTDNSSSHPQSLSYASNMLIASQDSRTLLHYYTFGKEGPDKKSGVLEELVCLACTDCLVLAGSINGSLYLWDIGSGELLHTWKPHYSRVNLVNIDDFIISASEDATIKIFRTSLVVEGRFEVFKEITVNVQPVTALKKIGRSIFTCARDKSFNVFHNWELAQQKFYHTSLNCLEISENYEETYIGGEDGSVSLYKSGETWEVDEKPITNIKLTNFDQYLIVSAQKIYVMNPKTGAKIKTFVMHTGVVTCLLCIPRPADFAAGALSHQAAKVLKKTIGSEPGSVNFNFARETREEVKDQEVSIAVVNNEELEKVKQANSILYRLWVEHCS